MNPQHTMRPLFTSLALFALSACGGSETGSLSFALTSSQQGDSTPTARDSLGTAFSVTRARAYVRHIEIDLVDGKSCSDLSADQLVGARCDGSDDSDKIVVDGPFDVDLASGTSVPSLDEVVIPAGTYKRVDVRFDDARSDEGLVSSSDPLHDLTMLASGSFDYEGETHGFRLALKFNEDARFESDAGVELSADVGQIVLGLDVSKWFSSLSITECLNDGDMKIDNGMLEIRDDGGSCSDVENTLKESIKTSGQLK